MHLNDSHAMAQMEDLLQQLVDLKKEEMRRTRNYRLTKFLMGTLPMLLILVASIWGSIALFQSLSEAFQNNPGLLNLGNFKGF
jgi:hypothetical protein